MVHGSHMIPYPVSKTGCLLSYNPYVVQRVLKEGNMVPMTRSPVKMAKHETSLA